MNRPFGMSCDIKRFLLLPTVQWIILAASAVGQIAQTELEPEFLQPLENLTVTQGRDVVFTCVVNHLGQYKVAWIKSDSKAILAIHTHLVAHNLRLAVTHNGHNTWKLHISNVQKNDSGTYMCQINTDPMRSQMGHLEIVVPPDILSDESSDGGVALEGGSIRLRCKATGVPDPTVQWRREDSKNIVLRHESGREKIVERTVKSDILTLTNVQRSDMGIYLCIASNGVPPSVSKRFLVQVHFQPSIQVTNQLVAAPIGSDVVLQCYVEASPKAMNSWYKEKGEKLMDGIKYSMSEHPMSDYGLMMNLTIKSIEKRDLGAYLCSSSNALGTASGAVRLQEIYMPPKTTISPKTHNNIHSHHKPTHSPKKSKLKPKKDDSITSSSTTSEPRIYQTINPIISRPPYWVIEEEPSGSSSKRFSCLPLINLCSVAAVFWVPAYLQLRIHFLFWYPLKVFLVGLSAMAVLEGGLILLIRDENSDSQRRFRSSLERGAIG